MTDFFAELGKAALREMNHPGSSNTRRERLRGAADTALTQHLSRPMAMDAALPRRTARDQEVTMPVRGGDPNANGNGGPNGNGHTAESLMASIATTLKGMAPEEVEKFFVQLMNFAQEDPGYQQTAGDETTTTPPNGLNGIRANNTGALDRRLAADQAIVRRRRIALDSANAGGFEQRWGKETAHINTGGTGWRLPGR